ncbi:MAG TPA: hypothetical protein PKD10_19425 [Paracoccaceae bacterium]|nr:hypothetical protein [Paracoccaceae bacterium]
MTTLRQLGNLRAAAIVLLLAGCVTEGGTVSDTHLGATGTYSRSFSAQQGLLHSFMVRAVHARRGGEERYGVATSWNATGLGWSFFREAYSYGRAYPYEATDERVMFCSSSGCSHIENGIILMTRAEFMQAAERGFAFKLFGRNRSVEGAVPPEAFREVLARNAGS